MARYNHFTATIKHKRVLFFDVPINGQFSFKDKPFNKNLCTRTGEFEYQTKDGEIKRLHTIENLEVYIN